MKIQLHYTPEGKAYSDFEAEETINRWINSERTYVEAVSTNNMIDCLRMAVAEGKIRNDVVFVKFTDHDWQTKTGVKVPLFFIL